METEDQAGNRGITLSDLYKIDRLPPQSERSWIEDESGKILAEDGQVFTNWVNGEARLSVHTGQVKDQPAVFNSGVDSVTADAPQGEMTLSEQDGSCALER